MSPDIDRGEARHGRRKAAVAIERLESAIQRPRALRLAAEDRALLGEHLDRLEACFLGGDVPTLTIALAGCTGAGKSTLINALAGAEIARTSEQRPCTTAITVYHHRDVRSGGLPEELQRNARPVSHDRDELRRKVLVDTPDLDSLVRDHRERTVALLRAAGLVLYVFTPERYQEERVWSVLRGEQRFSATAAVLNRADQVATADLDRIADDLRRRFAEVGVPGPVRVFRTVATRHVGGGVAGAPPAVDETDDLRRFLERELADAEITRMAIEQRQRTVGRLREAIDELAAPDEMRRVLDRLRDASAARAADEASRLAAELTPVLADAEAELVPLAVLRLHERFTGPFRTWLAVGDFLRFGLPGIVRRLSGGGAPASADAVRAILRQASSGLVRDRLGRAARAVQDGLYAAELPLARWREITAPGVEAEDFLDDVARGIEHGLATRSAEHGGPGAGVVRAISWLGWLGPVALLGWAAVQLARNFVDGRFEALALAGHLAAVTLLLFLVLQVLAAVLLPGGRRLATGSARRVFEERFRRRADGWLESYREELLADLDDLCEPLEALDAVRGLFWVPGSGSGAAGTAGEAPGVARRAGDRDAGEAAGPPAADPGGGSAAGAPAATPPAVPGRGGLADRLRAAGDGEG